MALNKYDIDRAIWPTVDDVVTKVRSLPRSLWLDLLREDQSRRWRGLYGVWVEEYLRLLPEVVEESGEDGLVLICGELELRRELGDQPQLQEYQHRFPQYARHLELQFTLASVFDGAKSESADCDTGLESDLVLDSKVPGLEILEEIGRGASSVVHRGRQASLNRNVAVKVLLSRALSAQHRERFIRESQIVGTLRHPNVIRVYDAIVHEGTMYLVMEFIDGPTLHDWAQSVPLQPKTACRLVAGLADAMHTVHTSGVLHRDLKPTNILMTSQEEPVITDFGLARWIDSPADLTNENTILGTPSYMSPEQITRKQRVGPSADVYSMGAILYELLTGRPPFVAATVLDTLSAVLEQLPVRPKKLVAGIPKDVETICLKCLEKTPAARYPNASDLRDDLIRYLDGKPIAARPVGVVGQGIRWVKRNPVVAVLVTAIVLLICVSATGFISVSQQRRQVAVDSLIESVSSADVYLLPSFFERIETEAKSLSVQLEPQRKSLRLGSRPWVNLTIAGALAGDATCQSDLLEYLPSAQPAETPSVVQVAARFLPTTPINIWNRLEAANQDSESLLRLACLVARIDPDDPRWNTISKAVADALVNQPAIDADYFARVLSPSFSWLAPHLVTLVHSEETLESVRSTSIALLARYGQNHPDKLAQLIPAAEPNDFRVLLDTLKKNVDQATPILKSALNKDWSLNQISKESPGLQSREWERKLDREHRRQATVAATLWHIGHRQDVLQKLRRNQNSGLRAWIIERLGLFEIPMEHLVEAARVESDAGVRQALLLAASQSSIPDSPAVRTTLLKRMSYFTSDEDPGVSSAGRWLISQTLNSPDSANETIEGNGNFRKFAGNEHVFVKVSRPGSFLLGSPEDELSREEDEAQIEVVIDYDFSIATTEVTVAQFRMFREKEYNSQYSPDAHCPMNNVTFFDAAAYCRWLSEQAGIPEDEMCYPPIEQIGPGMRLPENWLERSGYRLPTEAEWEYACRGGTDGPRYFGEGRELALRYLWCLHNGEDRTHPVAQLKPNNFGLFDMLGNINEMCHSSRLPGRFVFSAEDFLPRRGGDFTDVVQNVRVARYSTVECSAEWANLGFRIARRTPISK